MAKTIHKTNKNGISVRSVMIPFVVLLTILHITIIYLIIRINNTSSALSGTMNAYGNYRAEFSGIMSSTSVLSETTSSLMLFPTTEKGELNIKPLMAFAAEYQDESHRGNVIASHFAEYDVSTELKSLVNEAAAASKQLESIELHAIALVVDIYPLPDIPALKELPLPGLTTTEKNMPTEQKLVYARSLLVNEEYQTNKSALISSTNATMEGLASESGKIAGISGRKIALIQIAIRTITIVIIVLIVFTLLVLFLQLLRPLERIVKNIRTENVMDDKNGLREIRLISSAYNSLLARRANFEEFLRSSADTGILASLPDRNAFEEYMESERTNSQDRTLSLTLFEVTDYDKTLNNIGPQAAEQLLKTAAECVIKCFGAGDSNNCFVYETNKFAAVMTDVLRSRLDEAIERFAQEQSKWGISIFWGNAWTDDYSSTSLDVLTKEAERKLYIQKKVMFSDL